MADRNRNRNRQKQKQKQRDGGQRKKDKIRKEEGNKERKMTNLSEIVDGETVKENQSKMKRHRDGHRDNREEREDKWTDRKEFSRTCGTQDERGAWLNDLCKMDVKSS